MTNRANEAARRSAESLLGRWQRWLLRLAGVLAVFMLANTIYLLANRGADRLEWRFFADSDVSLPRLFQAMLLSHTFVGLGLAGVLAIFAVWHLPSVWRRARTRTVSTGVLFVIAGAALAISGWFIRTEGATRSHLWVWWLHVVCAAIAPLMYVAHRSFSFSFPTRRTYVRFGLSLGGVTAVLLAAHTMTHRGILLTHEAQLAREKGMHQGPGSRERVVSKYLEASFAPPGHVPEGSPFFPSAATTTSGDYLPSRIITRGDISSAEKLRPDLEQYGFVVNEKIGADTCQRCHQDIVEQWSKSAHRFASFNNPFYEATINDMREHANVPNRFVEIHQESYPETQDRIGMIKSKWCSGCHDPSLMLAGAMDRPIDRTSPQAQAGLTCLACHAIDKIHNTTGNGNYNIADEQEDPYLFPDAKSGYLAELHDSLVKAKPTVHKRQMLKPFFRTSEFCGSCHKVSLNVPVNNYRWFRGQNEYDNWHDSGVAHNASRTFYLPPAAKNCQECHMPLEPAPLGDVAAKDGMVRSHRFLAVNTALPFIRGDEETIRRIEAFLRDEKLSVDVFAIRGDRFENAVCALERTNPVLLPGERIDVDVVVRNKGVGHTFPGGTNDSNEGWLEFTVSDDAGNRLLVSGFVGEDGHVDPDAHFYRAVVLGHDGKVMRKRNAQDMHVMVYANVIGPGTADTVTYSFRVPEELAGRELTFSARLLWRKFDRGYTEFAFNTNRQAFARFEECPDLPITEIAADAVTLPVAERDDPLDAPVTVAAAEDWMRYNDYGIGLLLDGDTRGASFAFSMVQRVAPERVDGPRNLARTAVQEGVIEEAYKHLRRCEEILPANGQTAWVWGVALQEDGRYAEAAAAYERVLQLFPKDRATWRNLGRVLYLDGKYEEALRALDEVLAIDGEDRVAHYHKMLCLRALDRQEEARVAEAAYEVYKIDESAQELTLAHRLAHAGDNRESQRIHTHELLTPAQVAAGIRPGNVGCCGEAVAMAKESTADERP